MSEQAGVGSENETRAPEVWRGQAPCEGSMPLVMQQKDQVSTCFGKHHCLGPKDIQDSAWPKFGLQEPKSIYPPGRFRAGRIARTL